MNPRLLWVPLLLLGCEEISDFIPEVQFSRLEVEEIDFEHIDAGFVFQVDNPNPIRVRLDRFNYDLELQQISLLSGSEPEGLALPAGDSAEVRLPASLIWQDVWSTIQAIRGEDIVDFGLAGSFGFDTNIGPINIPYQADGSFPALRTPGIALGQVRVGGLDLIRGTGTIALDLHVDNDHRSNLRFESLNYDLALTGRPVASGVLSELGQVEGATTSTLTVPMTIDLVQAGGTIVDLLTTGRQADARFDATVDVDTPFGVVPLSIDERGRVDLVR
ncbi:MAG: hypothetical protein EA397_08260 [Deltaproteobacteria bacterium]|nr:MAG: hypothetical protein EA397_08260 [Deltaproteobacteria bacterium]